MFRTLFSLFISLTFHGAVVGFFIWVSPVFHLNLPVSLQNPKKQSYLSASLISSLPQDSSKEILKESVANIGDRIQQNKRGGNTKIKTNSLDKEEAMLKSGRKENKDLESKAAKKDKKEGKQTVKRKTHNIGAGSQEKYSGFLRHINDALIQNWTRPESVQKGLLLVCQLKLQLLPDGSIENVLIEKSSGNQLFDRSAIAAVHKIAHFAVPDDPEAFEAYFKNITINFENPDSL